MIAFTDMSLIAFVFSAAAFATALLSAALSFRIISMIQGNGQEEDLGSLPPRPILAEDGVEWAWHGNVEDGYTRGPFVVSRMPILGSDAWRGSDAEWVAYRDGERTFASPNLEDVLRTCEQAADD